MDRASRGFYRQLIAEGRLVSFVVDVIKNLDPDSKDAKQINSWIKFHRRRQTVKWRLGSRRFPIAHLGDSMIKDLINSGTATRIQNEWLAGDSWSASSVYHTVLMEAEYRNILTNYQQIWADVLQGGSVPPGDGDCVDPMHTYVRRDDGVVCLNCQQGITDEELKKLAYANLRGRLNDCVLQHSGASNL